MLLDIYCVIFLLRSAARFSLYTAACAVLSVVVLPCRKSVSAATLKQAWASLVIQRHWRGYRMRQVYQLVLIASVTIQAFTRGWIARKRYKKVSQWLHLKKKGLGDSPQ